MPIYLKTARRTAESGQPEVRAAVERILAEIREGGEAAARRFASTLDK